MKRLPTAIALVLSLACGVVSSALAQPPPAEFAVLAGAAVTCTVSSVQGNVGLANLGTITNTSCAITGAIEEGTAAAQAAYASFPDEYASFRTAPPCDFHNVSLAGAFLSPGVYCYDAAVTVTGSTLTLVGSATDTWIFRIGTLGTGALTGTNFNVVMTGGATCNNDVLWWTAQAATLTDSTFVGSILAGADITVTRGSLAGQVLAGGSGTTSTRTGAVTLTGTEVDFCTTTPPPPPPGPPVLPVFVIGDVEPHAVGNVVNFWGAQWWKNNFMSGFVNAGYPAFKGYADDSDNACGGEWFTLPGNSSDPPDTIPDFVLVLVTSTVHKDGPNISGDIQQILLVESDGGYGPAPGHRGNGIVRQVLCTLQAP